MLEDDVSTNPIGRSRNRKSSLAITITPESDKKKSHKKFVEDNLKKRLRALFSTVYDYSVSYDIVLLEPSISYNITSNHLLNGSEMCVNILC